MTKSKFSISVIIPCYNVAKYINNCLDSISKQITSYDYEIILINDASSDDTDKIINNYIKNNKLNIKYLKNETNIGAGASRNIAIKESTKEYISFIDSDDFIDDNYYENMITSIINNKSDIALSDIKLIYEDGTNSLVVNGCEGEETVINYINTPFAASPCNKIIKKELLIKYPFAEGIMNEDIASIIPILANSKKTSYTNQTNYNYVQHVTSVQNSSLSEKRFDIFKSLDIVEERIKDNILKKEIIDALGFQQLYLFFIYVIPKEKSLFKRCKYMRLFRKLSKKYDLKNNEFVKENLNKFGSRAKLYFKMIFNINDSGFTFLSSLLMSLYHLYYKIKNSKLIANIFTVIKKDINMKSLVKLAKKQSLMKNENIKISVVVPNYNYDNFLFQRIYSILNQDYKIYELIILDDCSKDNSRNTILEIEKEIKNFVNIKVLFNKENSGSAFKQWEKGFVEATGDYIWIAEADDYCSNKLISSLVKPIEKNNNIYISYANTAFINKNGLIIKKSIVPEIDIMNTGHWNNDYINNGIEEINNFSFLNCTIANVSSCIIKKGDYSSYFKMSGNYKQAGDWLFYNNIMKNGYISYINKPLNYYRVHGNNVTSTMNLQRHIDEIRTIYDYYKDEFNLNKKQLNKMNDRIEFLKKVWKVK